MPPHHFQKMSAHRCHRGSAARRAGSEAQHGKVVAGFAAFKNHLSYLPHSGSVFKQLPAEVAPYRTSSGALQFPIDKPLQKALVKKLIDVRLTEVLER